MKSFDSKIVLAAIFSGLMTFSALGQSAPAENIGPATPDTKQGKIIDGALSSQTRSTLQAAMNSVTVSDLSTPAK